LSRWGERLVFATAKPFAPANAHVVVHPVAAGYMGDIEAGM
jgi:hypothetical protein